MVEKIFILFTILLLLWIFLTLSIRFDTILIGCIASLIISILTYRLVIEGEVRSWIDPIKWINILRYLLYYLFNAEVKAHWSVIKFVLKGKGALKPGIVEVPYHLKSDLGITLVANSVTNTPGTVTIEVDEKRKRYFIHWIYVESFKLEDCYRMLISDFERGIMRFCK
ncbi:MAG: Na+/H+ antiporter subunit E [Nitrososphaerales archaeon]|nr:Na+/H+ antiporter subunit E [Nitrososphaerales archaeon]